MAGTMHVNQHGSLHRKSKCDRDHNLSKHNKKEKWERNIVITILHYKYKYIIHVHIIITIIMIIILLIIIVINF